MQTMYGNVAVVVRAWLFGFGTQHLRQNFVKTLQFQTDSRADGGSKAKERAAKRNKIASEIREAAQALIEEIEEWEKQLSDEHFQRGEEKRSLGLAVLELIDAKSSEMELEEIDFLDAVGDDNDLPAQTTTETERDEAVRLNDLLSRQLAQFQQAAAAADAVSPPPAQATPTPLPEIDPAVTNLNRYFDAKPEDLPSLEGTPTVMQATLLANLWFFFKAAPMGQVPAITFDAIGVPPQHVHSFVGDKIWEGFWGQASTSIKGSDWIPNAMLPILKHVSDIKAAEHAQHTVSERPSYARMEAAREAAKERKERGKPY
jgi:hypothetical protein